MTCGIFEESFWRIFCIILILYSIENNFIKNQTIELSITEANPLRLNALTQEKKLRKKEKKENASSNGTEEYQRYDYVSRIFRSFTKKKKEKNGVIRKLFSRESTHGPDRLPLTTWETSMKVFVEPNNRDVVIYGRP